MFLNELKEIGCSRNEVRAVRSKIQSHTGKLYRYRPLPNEEQLKQNEKLKEQIGFRIEELKGGIFIQTNKALNDPMDMFLTAKSTNYAPLIRAIKKQPMVFVKDLREKGFTDKEIKKVLRLNPDKASDFIREKIATTFSQYAASNFDNYVRDLISDEMNTINHLYSTHRVACFTETYNNMPMWNLYASDYQGVCFEYNIEKSDIIGKIFPVIYTDNLPDVYDMFSKTQVRNGRSFIPTEYQSRLFLFKTNDWSYEKEWRYTEVNYFNNVFWGFIDELKKKYPHKEKEITLAVNNQNSLDEILLEKMIQIFPDFIEKIGQFVLQLPPQQGKPIPDYSPCRIYLGHKILPEYEKELRNLAKVEVLKMSLTPKGYLPISIEEADKKKAQEFIEKADKCLDNNPQYEEAIQAYSESIAISPNVVAYINRGVCYSRTGRLQCALDDYKETINIDPSNPIAHYNAGDIYRRQGKNDLAIEEYSIALSKWHDSVKIYIYLTIVYMDECKYELAIETLKKGLENCKDFAKQLCENSDFTEALERHPSFINPIYYYGQ